MEGVVAIPQPADPLGAPQHGPRDGSVPLVLGVCGVAKKQFRNR